VHVKAKCCSSRQYGLRILPLRAERDANAPVIAKRIERRRRDGCDRIRTNQRFDVQDIGVRSILGFVLAQSGRWTRAPRRLKVAKRSPSNSSRNRR
jgi:hypothetical protein